MKLYNANLSPFTGRCRIAIYAKGLDVELVAPPDGTSSPAYKKINPTGRIPALEVDGVVVPESDAISEYLEDRFPEPALRPSDALERAQMRAVMRIADNYLVPPLVELFGQLDPGTRDAKLVADRLETLRGYLDVLEQVVDPRPYAVGESLSLADATLFPFFFFATRMLPVLGDKDPLAARAKLARWWSDVQQNEAVAKVNQEMEKALAEYLAQR